MPYSALPPGSPPPKVRWFKNGLEIHSDQPDLSLTREGSLVINAVSASHSGDFKCVATNEAGSVERKTRLKVNGETESTSPFNLFKLMSEVELIQVSLFFSPPRDSGWRPTAEPHRHLEAATHSWLWCLWDSVSNNLLDQGWPSCECVLSFLCMRVGSFQIWPTRVSAFVSSVCSVRATEPHQQPAACGSLSPSASHCKSDFYHHRWTVLVSTCRMEIGCLESTGFSQNTLGDSPALLRTQPERHGGSIALWCKVSPWTAFRSKETWTNRGTKIALVDSFCLWHFSKHMEICSECNPTSPNPQINWNIASTTHMLGSWS